MDAMDLEIPNDFILLAWLQSRPAVDNCTCCNCRCLNNASYIEIHPGSYGLPEEEEPPDYMAIVYICVILGLFTCLLVYLLIETFEEHEERGVDGLMDLLAYRQRFKEEKKAAKKTKAEQKRIRKVSPTFNRMSSIRSNRRFQSDPSPVFKHMLKPKIKHKTIEEIKSSLPLIIISGIQEEQSSPDLSECASQFSIQSAPNDEAGQDQDQDQWNPPTKRSNSARAQLSSSSLSESDDEYSVYSTSPTNNSLGVGGFFG